MMVLTSEEGDVSVGRVESKVLDAGTTAAFKEAMKPLLRDGAKVVLDLSKVEFIDSSGLGALVSSLKAAHGVNAEIKLFGLRKPVRALFELVRMHRVFEVFNSAEEAISSYKG
ncbi:anti-sigma B factor antagonist [Granulicella pectinivorans]|uniref:Anti-sigma factor antagonist n=1 Tax=Granulicella pectinivorans TaxID=474950 RepID=A0A1I6LUT0_9BACT|nr:STAS domain-containing protein [Granulicella pectinivorans]SFS07178.1 anti-sigma B factor antagonist [Granulicella pectinivorans]